MAASTLKLPPWHHWEQNCRCTSIPINGPHGDIMHCQAGTLAQQCGTIGAMRQPEISMKLSVAYNVMPLQIM
eukprot:3510100-Ditylum_brightwellii.AAC.1